MYNRSKCKFINLPEDNIRENLDDLENGDDFSVHERKKTINWASLMLETSAL